MGIKDTTRASHHTDGDLDGFCQFDQQISVLTNNL